MAKVGTQSEGLEGGGEQRLKYTLLKNVMIFNMVFTDRKGQKTSCNKRCPNILRDM